MPNPVYDDLARFQRKVQHPDQGLQLEKQTMPIVIECELFDEQEKNFYWCREGGSNPHDRKGRRILSPLRLPVPPSRRGDVSCSASIS